MQLMRQSAPSLLLAAGLILSGCQTEVKETSEQHIFGNGTKDHSRVLARVNGYAITENMLDLRLEELHLAEREQYGIQEGRRLFLRQMVDEALKVQDAESRKLDREPAVAQVLISERRNALVLAQRVDLIKDKEPDIDAVRAYFLRNRDQYVAQGSMRASHVECLTREDAEEAYRLLTVEGLPLDRVVHSHSVNNETKLRGGLLGHFNQGGFLQGIADPLRFTQKIWDLEERINPPIEFKSRWHVVVIHERTPERHQSLEEAYSSVVQDMQSEFHKSIVDIWLRSARSDADIQYFGDFRPGQGLGPKELMERAFYLKDVRQQLDLLTLLVDDYPESDLADKALLMAANIAMDGYEYPMARFFLSELLQRYPDSDLADDAAYILENMDKPGFTQPQSIEDLRRR